MRPVEVSVAAWRQALDSVLELGAPLTPAQWAAPTGCPKWSVGDIYAHLVGAEDWMSGRGANPADPEAVLARRGQPAADVLAELHRVFSRRLTELERLPPTEAPFAGTGPAGMPGTTGPVTPELQWMLRAFDVWVHEQDVRWAVGAPATLGMRGGQLARDLFLQTLPLSVGRIAPPGTSARLIVIGELPVDATVVVGNDGKGRPAPSVDRPTTQVTLRWESYVRLCCGRTTASAEPAWTDGDPALAQRLLENLTVTP
jgi:uncharacterized protein (TIGR03083 family)